MSVRPSREVGVVEVEQRLQRVGRVVDRGVGVAPLGEPGGHRGDGEVLGRDLGQLVPVQRRRHRRAGLGADAVRRGDRAVARVLVEVDEDPRAALLLPPARRHLVGQAALQGAGEGDGGMADVDERPARLDAHVDVEPSAARGLGKAGVAELGQQRPRLGGDARGVGEVGAGLGIEVQAQLVGVVDVGAAHRPRMEGDRPHLARPRDDRQLGGADLVGGRPEGNWMRAVCDVVRGALGDPLLVEGVARRARRAWRARCPGTPPWASARASSAARPARA